MDHMNIIQSIAATVKSKCESDIKELEKYISEKYPDMYIRITSSDTENYFSKAYHKAIEKHFEDAHGINLYSVDVPSVTYHRSFENSLSNLSERSCLNYHYSKLRQDLKCSIKHFKNKIVLTTTATSFHEGELKLRPESMLFHAFGHVINQDHSSYFDGSKRNIEFFANGNRKFEISQEEAEKIQAVLDWK